MKFLEKKETLGLAILFGVMYFIQGIAEPNEGLISQPVRSLLKNWGHNTSEMALFFGLLALPWSFKPIYGLLTDFIPFFSYRRRSYLILTSLLCFLSLAYLFLFPPIEGEYGKLLLLLFVPTMGIAFSDVVIDALMIEKGQPLNMTGTLQSVQWTSIYAATILVGVIAGYLSGNHLHHFSFLICALFSLLSLMMAVWFVKEDKCQEKNKFRFRVACDSLLQTVKSPSFWGVGSFLFLWNFNPFSTTVLYMHMTGYMGMSEQFYGNTISVLSIACILAAVLYGFYCRKIEFEKLIHCSIISGIFATVCYWWMSDTVSAMVVTFFVGFTYMTATLIQLDLAARTCEPRVAGTTFACLMALSNFSVALSTAFGGVLYDNWTSLWGNQIAFDLLIGVGALFTCLSWLVVPFLIEKAKSHANEAVPSAAKL